MQHLKHFYRRLSRNTNRTFWLGIVGALLLQTASAVTIGLNFVTSDSHDVIELNVGDLTNGQTVRCETFVDLNRNGAIDSEEPLVESFLLTDGQVPLIGGVRNLNASGDEDGATNGSIAARFFYTREAAWMVSISADFICRVSDPQNAFAPESIGFSIPQQSRPQGVQGRITWGNGAPMTNALVMLHHFYPAEMMYGTVTDTNGNYRFYTEPGSYALNLTRDAFVPSPEEIVVTSNEFKTVNVTATNTGLFISGKIVGDETNTLPGMFIVAQGLGYCTFSDAEGNFSSPPASMFAFNIAPHPCSLAKAGYFLRDSSWSEDGGGFTISARKANAQVHGRIMDDGGNPLRRIGIQAAGFTPAYSYGVVRSFTADGSYSLPLGSGKWNLYLRGFEERDLRPEADLPAFFFGNEALEINFVLRRLGERAHLTGQVLDNFNQPVTNITIVASTIGNYLIYKTTDLNGRFDFRVEDGAWQISMPDYVGAPRGYFGTNMSCQITNGVDLEIVYRVQRANGKIIGSLKTPEGMPLTNIYVRATATISGKLREADARTDNEGNFSMNVLKGTWEVRAFFGQGYGGVPPFSNDGPQTVVVTGTNLIQFVAHPYPRRVSGRVVASDGSAVPNARIHAQRSGTNESYSAESDGDGNFVLSGNAGVWSVSVRAEEDLFDFGQSYSVTTSNITNAVIVLERGTNRITGFLHDRNGTPIPDVRIHVMASRQGSPITITSPIVLSDSRGHFDFPVISGDWTLHFFWCEDLAHYALRCPVAPVVTISNTDLHIDLALESFTNFVRGRLIDENGNGIPNVLLRLTANSPGGASRLMPTDGSGYFESTINGEGWFVAFDSSRAAALGFRGVTNSFSVNTDEDYNGLILTASRSLTSIASSVQQSDGRFKLQWAAASGGHYAVQTSTNLVEWITINIVTASGPSAVYISSNPVASDQRLFYRIQQLP